MAGYVGSQLMTADGVVGVSGKPIRIYAIHVLSGATAGIVKLKAGTATGGTIRIQETCPVVSTGNLFNYGEDGVLFPTGCYYEEVIDANVTSTLVSYSQEL